MKADAINRLMEWTAREEGKRLRMYKCSAGYNTIGIGHNLDAKPISERAAWVIFEDDIADVVADLDRALPWLWEQPEDVQVALGDMCFQMGISRLLKFRKMLAALERGDREEAAREALESAWARQTPARAARVAALIRGTP